MTSTLLYHRYHISNNLRLCKILFGISSYTIFHNIKAYIYFAPLASLPSVCFLTHNLDSYLQANNRVFVVFVYISVCVCVCLSHQRQWQSLPRVFALNINWTSFSQVDRNTNIHLLYLLLHVLYFRLCFPLMVLYLSIYNDWMYFSCVCSKTLPPSNLNINPFAEALLQKYLIHTISVFVFAYFCGWVCESHQLR